MKIMLGKKIEMSQIFDKEGNVIPITLIEAGPVVVTQIKTKERDGYEAIQVGYGRKSAAKMKKPQKGHLVKIRNPKSEIRNTRWMREFRLKPNFQFPISNFQLGDSIDVLSFKEGDMVTVSGISKGKGFQGVVKRHGFHGGPRTHGQKHSEREPGSIGATWPQRVIKGMRMAGRMGGERVTVRNLKIVKIDPKQNLLAIQGAIPGARGTLLEIKQNI